MTYPGRDSRRFRLRNGEIHVWRASLDVAAETSRRCGQFLSAEERRRAAQFHFPRDRKRYILSRDTLRTLLGHYLEVPPGEVTFDRGKNTKPQLASPFCRSGLHFNLSHSHGKLLVAITRGFPVGVDVEKIRPELNIEAIAKRFFSSIELEQLNGLDSSVRCSAFFAAWTRKEAYLKARGEGISHGLAQFAVSLNPAEPARLVADYREPEAIHRWVHVVNPQIANVGAEKVPYPCRTEHTCQTRRRPGSTDGIGIHSPP